MTFWDQGGLQGTHMDTLKPKDLKSITFTVRGGFFTFLAILAHSVACTNKNRSAPWWQLEKLRISSHKTHQDITAEETYMY